MGSRWFKRKPIDHTQALSCCVENVETEVI